MKVLVKATIVLGLLPAIGAGVTHKDTAIAQNIVPINTTTKVNLSENDILNINGGIQADGNLFHSFQTFNLEQQQTANFVVTPSTDAIIGQVIGGTDSHINGLLKVTGSNADFYLINPNGLLFGPNARLDLGGSFTATTATHLGNGERWFEVLSNPDYQAFVTPPSHFGFSHPGTIINQGQLFVAEGNSLRLLATQINNAGPLGAPDGEVTLLTADSGQTISLKQNDGLLSLEVDIDSALLETLPALITGGDLNHSNTLIIDSHGQATLINNSPTSTPFFSLQNTGNISTQGITGGEINLLGDTLQVTDSLLNATGHNSGGTIHIGGDYQGQGSLLRADQIYITDTTRLVTDTINGNGGQVIVWSDGTTIFDGNISAQSATGDGGLVEISGLNQLTIGENTTVNTAAPQGAPGIWLLDPTDLTVVDTGGAGGIVPAELPSNFINDSKSTINASTIVSALNSTNVILQATDIININSDIDASGNSSSSDLFLDTTTLNLNERITLQGNGRLSGTASNVNIGINGSIQNGIDAAMDGGIVNLAATTYREGDTITLDHILTLQGQGQDNTIISGDADADGTGNHQVLKITSTADNSILTDLTIQDGLRISNGAGLENDGDKVLISDVTFFNNEIPSGGYDGGAIHNRGSLTLNNTIFNNNRTSSDGGAIDIEQGSVEINGSTLTNNQADDHGGAIDVDPNGSLTISNTNFNNNIASNEGGAIYLEGNTELNSVTFLNNTANQGGGIFNETSGLLEITNTDFLNNQATTDGGGLYNNRGETVITNSNFESNNADRGGGLFNGGTATLNNIYFDSNQATYDGGGLYNQIDATNEITTGNFFNNSAQSGGAIYNRATLRLLNNTIASNQATGTDSANGGAGILNTAGGRLIVDNSLIALNTSLSQGGGILNLASDNPTVVNVANSSIIHNQAITQGGGIANNISSGLTSLAELIIINSTISNNQASTGGGIDTVGPTDLTNVTITENTTSSSGGGISATPNTVETPTLINTLVANNQAPNNPDVEGQFNDQGNNLIGIDQGSTGLDLSTLVGTVTNPLNPNLTPLNNNLGSLASHQIRVGSPAANSGNNSAATASDQHGQPRIIGGTVDIGAIESDILPEMIEEISLIEPADTTEPTDSTSSVDPIDPIERSEPVEPDPETLVVKLSSQLQPVASDFSNPQRFSVEELANIPSVNLNNDSLSSQEEKSEPSLNAEQRSPSLTIANGRLRYFEEEVFEYFEDSFSKDYEAYWQLPQTQPVTLASVQHTLHQANQIYQTDTAVIYAKFVPQAPFSENSTERFVLPDTVTIPMPDDQLLLLLVSANGEPIQQLVNVSRAELTRQAKLFRLAVSDPEDPLSYKVLARQMHEWLLAPLQQSLVENQIDHVMYSLDQGLRTIPLAALMDGDSFIVEQYTVSLVPSIGLTQLQIGDLNSKPSPFDCRRC
ncbi:MAG: filamentous hemagglutinin N-terminal domain-containing protein [Cyanobacteria bacterium P01_C01_bin.118]